MGIEEGVKMEIQLISDDELYHFNPFHDNLGRFTSKIGGTIKSKAPKSGDKSNDSYKYKAEVAKAVTALLLLGGKAVTAYAYARPGGILTVEALKELKGVSQNTLMTANAVKWLAGNDNVQQILGKIGTSKILEASL